MQCTGVVEGVAYYFKLIKSLEIENPVVALVQLCCNEIGNCNYHERVKFIVKLSILFIASNFFVYSTIMLFS